MAFSVDSYGDTLAYPVAAGETYSVMGYTDNNHDIRPLVVCVKSIPAFPSGSAKYYQIIDGDNHLASNAEVLAATFTATIDGYAFLNIGHNADSVHYFRHKIKVMPNVTDPLWYGKKVVLLGTSVGYGSNADTNYAKEAANYLGFDLINTSVPGLAIHTNADGSQLAYGSSSLSIAEYATQGVTIPTAPATINYNSYYRTWEHIFASSNADADLWIYAVGPNNVNFATTDWDAFDKANWKYLDNSDFSSHRSTFLGALLFLMDKMYTLNPNARMLLLLDSAFAYDDTKLAFSKLSAQWNIPILDLYADVNISPKSLLAFNSDGGTNNHPSTYGQQILGKMLAGRLHLYS
jgi:hypothetical protein